MAKYYITDRNESKQEIEVQLSDYQAAAAKGVSLSQYLENEYGGSAKVREKYGTVLEQCMDNAGMVITPDHSRGIQSPRISEITHGNSRIDAGSIVRGTGERRHTPDGRLLMPAVVMEVMRYELEESSDAFVAQFDGLIAVSDSVTSSIVDQPTINTDAAGNPDSQPIGQLALPPVMVSITTDNKVFRIPTSSIGLQISEQAQSQVGLDLVSLIMTKQAREERIRRIESDFKAMVEGDVDIAETALPQSQITDYDPSISSNGEITQLGWVKFLREDYRKMTVSHALMTLETAMAIENRTGRPTIQTDNPNSPRIDTQFTIENLGLPTPKVILMEPEFIGANTIVALDSNWAIRRVINVSAAYSGIEDFVLRRGTAFRVDTGVIHKKLFADAWKVVTLTV